MLQAVDQRRHDACTSHAERVTERDRPTVHVQFVHWNAQVFCRRNNLRGKRLIDFDQVDLINRHACTL